MEGQGFTKMKTAKEDNVIDINSRTGATKKGYGLIIPIGDSVNMDNLELIKTKFIYSEMNVMKNEIEEIAKHILKLAKTRQNIVVKYHGDADGSVDDK